MYIHCGSDWKHRGDGSEPDFQFSLVTFSIPIFGIEFRKWGYICFELLGFFIEWRFWRGAE